MYVAGLWQSAPAICINLLLSIILPCATLPWQLLAFYTDSQTGTCRARAEMQGQPHQAQRVVHPAQVVQAATMWSTPSSPIRTSRLGSATIPPVMACRALERSGGHSTTCSAPGNGGLNLLGLRNVRAVGLWLMEYDSQVCCAILVCWLLSYLTLLAQSCSSANQQLTINTAMNIC